MLDHGFFLLIALTWSFSFLLMDHVMPTLGPQGVAVARMAGGLAIMLVVLFWRRRPWRPRGRQWAMLSVIVAVGYLMPFVLQPLLIARHPSSFIGMMVAFVPICTICAGAPLLRQLPTRGQVVGVFGGLACLSLVFYDALRRAIGVRDLLLVLLIPIGYAVANTLVRRWFHAVPPSALAAWCLAGGSLALTPLAWATEEVDWPGLPGILWALLLLGPVATGIMTHAFYYLVFRRGPLYAGMVTYLIPLGALLWGHLAGEMVTGLQLSGLLGVLAMVAVGQLSAPARVLLVVEEAA